MTGTEYFKTIVEEQHKGKARGITSVCTANEFVLTTAIERAYKSNSNLLIESTCNQVNQFGGYTGMKPTDFISFIKDIADEKGLPEERLILGGDHLGPNPWKEEPADTAMAKAGKLVEEYVLAGYKKIHIDTSMYLADDEGDRSQPMDDQIVARRAAELALRAEKTFKDRLEQNPGEEPPFYVIGTEVPVPGGTEEEEKVEVTRPANLKKTIEVFKKSFIDKGLSEAWERIMAVVVQPGVEFGADYIVDYNRANARELSKYLQDLPGIIFETHSTDYQKPEALKQLVEDGFCILKVGPALTYAMREALFSLAFMEEDLEEFLDNEKSNLPAVLDRVMVENPADWQKYYRGTAEEKAFLRKFSYSDRSRYYWADPSVEKAVNILIENLRSIEIPHTLISQYMPAQYRNIREGCLDNKALSLIKDKIERVMTKYSAAEG